MTLLKCLNIDNTPKGNNNTDIDITKLHQIIKSGSDRKEIYIRFVVEDYGKSKDIYWILDNIEERDYNFKLITDKMNKEFYIGKS